MPSQRRSQKRTRSKRQPTPRRASGAPGAAGTGGQAATTGSQAPAGGAAQAPTRPHRLDLLRALQTARGSDLVVAYVTSSRPGLSSQMSLDAVRRIGDHMPESKVGQIDLFISSDGGDSIVPWRLMTLLREYAKRVDVLVPHRAFSAATLSALGADRIVMHPMGMLGPIDPTVHDFFGPVDPETGQRAGVSVEDVAAYNRMISHDLQITGEPEKIRAFEVLAEKVHPLTLGRVRRGSSQARMLGGKLLRLRDPNVSDEDVERLVKALTEDLHYHGHPINRVEAAQLNLPVDSPPEAVEKAMWELYVAYEDELEMQLQFDQIGDAARVAGVPPIGAQPRVARIDDVRRAIVESPLRADVFVHDLEITIGRNADGALVSSLVVLNAEWTVEED